MCFRLKMGNRFLSIMEPEQDDLIEQAVDMHNSWWGDGLKVCFKKFSEQVRDGVCIVNVESTTGRLLGFIQGLLISFQCLKNRESWTQTWDGITGNGTFMTHNPNGDCLVCVNIVRPRTARDDELQQPVFRQPLSQQQFRQYIYSDQDPSIRFHRKPKGGYRARPKIFQILPRGRPQDGDALGYNILFLYPRIVKLPMVDPAVSCTVQLVEAAMLFCFKERVSRLVAYSRPSFLARHFVRAINF